MPLQESTLPIEEYTKEDHDLANVYGFNTTRTALEHQWPLAATIAIVLGPQSSLQHLPVLISKRSKESSQAEDIPWGGRSGY